MLVDGDWNYLYKCALALCQLIGSTKPTIYCKGKLVVDVRKSFAMLATSVILTIILFRRLVSTNCRDCKTDMGPSEGHS